MTGGRGVGGGGGAVAEGPELLGQGLCCSRDRLVSVCFVWVGVCLVGALSRLLLPDSFGARYVGQGGVFVCFLA